MKSIPLPTIDRPFAIELWPIFVRAYSAVLGYSPTDFKFQPGKTPMSTFRETAIGLISYYVIIFGGRELMKHRKPFTLNGPFMVHNLYLTLISGCLLVLFVEQLLPTLVRHGVFHAVCRYSGGWTKELVTLYYVSQERLFRCVLHPNVCSSTTSPNISNSSTPCSSSSRRSRSPSSTPTTMALPHSSATVSLLDTLRFHGFPSPST